jgi:hypothetical protein
MQELGGYLANVQQNAQTHGHLIHNQLKLFVGEHPYLL